MKKSSYKAIAHLYIMLFIILAVITGLSYSMVIYIVSTVKPDGQTVLNSWPIDFTNDFSQQIVFTNGSPQITETGRAMLTKEDLWLQVIDENGDEVLSCNKPPTVADKYSAIELLELYKSGGGTDYTPLIGNTTNNGEKWTYIIGFPVQISKITMYVDAHRFTSGKPIILALFTATLTIFLFLGGLYGFWTTKQLFKITKAVEQIASRSYIGTKNRSVFGDVYDSLNVLDSEIRTSDEERKKTEIMREEWIANITHDLKTPLSPIRGYAELMTEDNLPPEDVKRYGETILKNTVYAETLVDDLKLTYQLKNNMIPINRKDENIKRFLKEVIIDILNNPKYVNRKISFAEQNTPVTYQIDCTLMKRAFNNLIFNSLVHNPPETEIAVSFVLGNNIQIHIRDNGRGMERNESYRLFERYYRGTNTGENIGGTGLGMAIAKQIIELHGGNIFVESISGVGTSIAIHFPLSN